MTRCDQFSVSFTRAVCACSYCISRTVRLWKSCTLQQDTFRNYTVIVCYVVPLRSPLQTTVWWRTLQWFLQETISSTVVRTVRCYITTEASIQWYTKSPVLVTQCSRYRTQEVRLDRTQFCDFTRTWVVSTASRSLVTDYWQTRFLIDTLARVCQQQTVSTADLSYRTYTVVTISNITHQANVVCYVFVQRHDLRHILCPSEVQIPSPILVFNRSSVQCDFKTLVLDVTGINQLFVQTWYRRNLDSHNLVSGVFLIISSVQVDAVFQETQIQTYFPRRLTFWLQVVVIRLRFHTQVVNLVTTESSRSIQCVCTVDQVRFSIVTYLCPWCTYLSKWNPWRHLIAKCFVNQPRTRYRWVEVRECTMTVTIYQWRRPVVTSCYIQIDLVLPASTYLTYYRHHSLFARYSTAVIDGILRVVDEVLVRNNQTTASTHRQTLREAVEVFTTNETVDFEIVVQLLVSMEVCIQVGLFLSSVTHTIVTTFVCVTATRLLFFVTNIVVVVATFCRELQPVC